MINICYDLKLIFGVFSYKFRIIYFLFFKIFSSIKFSFFSWIVVRYRTYISHHSSIYLTWSSWFISHDYIDYFLNLLGSRRASSLYRWVGSWISLMLNRSCSSLWISGKRTFAVLLAKFSICSGNIILLNNVWIAWCVVYLIISTFRSFVAQNLLLGHRWCLLYSCSFFIIFYLLKIYRTFLSCIGYLSASQLFLCEAHITEVLSYLFRYYPI